ncbi:ImmA/IrrE family metallo-endopeptidase [Parasedimentitalea psychrophila]|uniref:ImmA/IrrE family metallo-endopeptidase n=1 Tax=Parasedimentitalea psychrophila TaxID=2997337 RepID=A0A9Y2P8N9_9RHOB|nr:ImmA/IrrE family metallo-endopeptidase [Parasedimentitalea psychrophila]WIY27258.1 ImmA/IrrE family metallo-endopeptidase [Parasedimentitalea psychrophila]
MTIEFHAPKALGASKAGVEKFAEELALKIGFSAGDSIEELVQRIGGKLVVGSSGHGDEESGSIVARNVNEFEIFVSRHTSLKRDRFTIAHELGHLLLHFGAIKKQDEGAVMRATRYVDQSDQDQQRAEWEANWFAAAFLMPSDEFAEAFTEGGVHTAAQRCGVSLQAAKIRAENLNIS